CPADHRPHRARAAVLAGAGHPGHRRAVGPARALEGRVRPAHEHPGPGGPAVGDGPLPIGGEGAVSAPTQPGGDAPTDPPPDPMSAPAPEAVTDENAPITAKTLKTSRSWRSLLPLGKAASERSGEPEGGEGGSGSSGELRISSLF